MAVAGVIFGLLAMPAAAWPQETEPTDPDTGEVVDPISPTPGKTPKPSRREAKLKVDLDGLSSGMLNLGDRVVATAKLTPSISGEPLRFALKRGGKVVERRKVSVGGNGKASWRLRPVAPGKYSVKVQHPRSTRVAPAADVSKKFGISYRSLSQGSFGPDVALLNRGLKKLAFVTSSGQSFSDATGRAILAYRKANGMPRNEFASVQVVKRILAGKGEVKLRYPNAGRHVEGDIGRQILILADDGKPVRIYHTSSGAAATPTVVGKYRFYMYQPGTNNVGMYYSAYFIRGYAIHGYPSVPTYPASHGCFRVPMSNAKEIYDWVDIGMRIFTYH